MGNMMKFDYYYGIEAEQFSFYRVPRLLIKDERFKELSSDAKLLYGLMLDRMSLSMKNGWFDDENRAYIHYTLDNIMEDLGCAKEKCVKVLAELDSKKGIGLIEKKRQGLGKPDIIYVKNFATLEVGGEPESQPESLSNTDVSTEVRKSNFKRFDNQTLLWSSFFVTLLAKKIPLFIQLFLPHEALHNYCNYADAHNYIQHMQIPLPLDKVTAPF